MTITSIEYLNNSLVYNRFKDASLYQKKALTLLRFPSPSEIGTTLITYVKDLEAGSVRVESSVVISEGQVLARNPDSIGEEKGNLVYNEWVISPEVIVKNYGQDVLDSLTDIFQPFRKSALLKAILLTPEIMADLNVEGDYLPIKVNWSNTPMMAKIGDYLTSEGYSIAADNMCDYVLVTD